LLEKTVSPDGKSADGSEIRGNVNFSRGDPPDLGMQGGKKRPGTWKMPAQRGSAKEGKGGNSQSWEEAESPGKGWLYWEIALGVTKTDRLGLREEKERENDFDQIVLNQWCDKVFIFI